MRHPGRLCRSRCSASTPTTAASSSTAHLLRCCTSQRPDLHPVPAGQQERRLPRRTEELGPSARRTVGYLALRHPEARSAILNQIWEQPALSPLINLFYPATEAAHQDPRRRQGHQDLRHRDHPLRPRNRPSQRQSPAETAADHDARLAQPGSRAPPHPGPLRRATRTGHRQEPARPQTPPHPRRRGPFPVRQRINFPGPLDLMQRGNNVGAGDCSAVQDRLQRVEHGRVLDRRGHRLVAAVGDPAHGLAQNLARPDTPTPLNRSAACHFQHWRSRRGSWTSGQHCRSVKPIDPQ